MSLSETAEITYGESVLHILAQNSAYGYEFQRFLQDWFFAWKLFDEKNREIIRRFLLLIRLTHKVLWKCIFCLGQSHRIIINKLKKHMLFYQSQVMQFEHYYVYKGTVKAFLLGGQGRLE